MVLDPVELAIIRDRVNAINASIREIAAAAGVAVLDLNAFITDLLTNGREYAGITLTGSFLTGGLVGYDGIHPTETGYALIANEWISFLNRETGTDLRPVELAPFIFGTASSSVSSLAQASDRPRARGEANPGAWRRPPRVRVHPGGLRPAAVALPHPHRSLT